jgi:hypothetical protein
VAYYVTISRIRSCMSRLDPLALGRIEDCADIRPATALSTPSARIWAPSALSTSTSLSLSRCSPYPGLTQVLHRPAAADVPVRNRHSSSSTQVPQIYRRCSLSFGDRTILKVFSVIGASKVHDFLPLTSLERVWLIGLEYTDRVRRQPAGRVRVGRLRNDTLGQVD